MTPTTTVYMDVKLEAQRQLQSATAMIVAAITDVATRTHVAMRFADIFAWGDNEFIRSTFLACCGVEEQHMGSSYIQLIEEM